MGRALPHFEHEAGGSEPAKASVTCGKAGVKVGIGSDGEKENNNLDLVEEMKFRVAAPEGDDARPDRRRSVGRSYRQGDDRRCGKPSAWAT